MRHLRIIHKLRTTIFLLVLGSILSVVGILLWANYTGMPKSWRQAVERAIAQHGIHVEIGELSYNPFQGIMAKKVLVFASDERKQVISRLEDIILDIDNAKLAKGQIQIAKVKLSNARLVLPVDPNDPDSTVLNIDDLQGEFIPPGNPHIEVRNARGTIEGVQIILNAKITNDETSSTDIGDRVDPKNRRELLAKIIGELRQWSFDKDAPPQLRIQCIGKRSELDQLKATIEFQAKSIGKNRHTIDHVEAEAKLHENLLSVHSLSATNGTRRLNAHLHYELDRQYARFDLSSTLEIPELLQFWLNMKPLNELSIAGDQELKASGEFQLLAGESPKVHATGQARCEFASLKGIRFNEIETSFSWRNGDLFLKGLSLSRGDGRLQGKALIQGDLVQLDLDSTLLPEFYRPLFRGKNMEKIIDQFSTNAQSRMELQLEGGFDRKDPRAWAYTGKATLKDITYRGVDLAKVESDLALSSAQMDFSNGTAVFDYSNYPLAKRFGGPDRGTLEFDSIHYNRRTGRHLKFKSLEGTFWPAPLCRLFLNKTADHLEKYRFHSPPRITSSGTIDLEHKRDTLIEIDFVSKHTTEYVLLGSPVNLGKASGKVAIRDDGVNINDLNLEAFNGSIEAELEFPRNEAMRAKLKAANLSMNEINSTYGMSMNCGGLVGGEFEFSMIPGQVATMDGEGNFKLIKAELFSVPIFGPLSHLLQAVLGDKRVGAQRAKEALANFVIQDGVLASKDFRTTTTSLVFAGDGWVDLDKKTMDMTLRMNARGLLGLLTLPFSPVYGLFQFRGSGELKDPQWERVSFTKPAEEIEKLLLKKPRNE